MSKLAIDATRAKIDIPTVQKKGVLKSFKDSSDSEYLMLWAVRFAPVNPHIPILRISNPSNTAFRASPVIDSFRRERGYMMGAKNINILFSFFIVLYSYVIFFQ